MEDKKLKILSSMEPIEWFNIDEYNKLLTLGDSGIYNEIYRRLRFQYRLQLHKHNNTLYRLAFKNELKQAITSGFASYKGNATEPRGSSITEGNYEKLNKIITTHRKIFRQGGEKQVNNTTLGNINPEICLTVSLRVKNSVIMREFKNVIDAARIKYNEPEPLATEKIETTIKKIILNKSLPYADLMLWAEIEGWRIPDTAMARILFPDDLLKEPREITTLTKKYADIMKSINFTSSLHYHLSSRE